jgi:hypothetical protein
MSEQMTLEQMQAMILKLTQENAALKTNAKAPGAIKVSAKGAVSLYGLGRFPVTLYASQWQKLFAQQEAVTKFITDNAASLATKEA